MDDPSSVDQDYDLSDYDHYYYSKTPPRTKILRKNRERKQQQHHQSKHKTMSSTVSSPKFPRTKHNFSRRSSVNAMFEELVANADYNNDSDQGGKRLNKRQMKLLRGSERDLKLDIVSATQAAVEKLNEMTVKTPQPSYQIESCKRFMSLSCRTVPCPKQLQQQVQQQQQQQPNLQQNNINNKKTINVNKSEDITDQVGDECPTNRVDFYKTFSMLIRMGCGDKQPQERGARRGISREEHLWQTEIKDLIWLELQAFHADRTPNEEDEYLCKARESVEPLLNDIMTYRFKRNQKCYQTQYSNDSGVEDDCNGCLSIYCNACLDSQNEALKDIEELMERLEFAESLFPSSHAFSELYPLYNSKEFVNRVKAISLWYNMTKHQRLILVILIALIDNKSILWPTNNQNGVDSSPSDSNSSTGSSSANYDYLNDTKICLEFYNYTINSMKNKQTSTNKNISPYRKYIENVLKTRTLHKSLGFLNNLQFFVVRKAFLTLEKPKDDDLFKRDGLQFEEDELQRYGCWSPESKALSLPSYRACFLFLAFIPLEVIYEFLKMRLEQKPEKPSPLSVRQLMKELKDGLKIATLQKSRITNYLQTIINDRDDRIDYYRNRLKDYDDCMLMVFRDYLDYLEQWALLNHQTFQKNLLEEEWHFSLKLIEFIPGGSVLLGAKFASILCSILKSVSSRLKERVDEVLSNIQKDDSILKQSLFAVCREIQSMFNDEREMSIKSIAFCKTISKHKIPDESVKELTIVIISLKCSITDVIATIQTNFDQINLEILDELERPSLISRMREILMQGYRYGFEFYKEISEITNANREKLVGSMVQFANLWMKFVTERCERGRGMRPRWSYQGLEFLLAVCEPRNTKHLTDQEFEDLKRNMDICISHVIGTTAQPQTPDSGFVNTSSTITATSSSSSTVNRCCSIEHIRVRSRGSSPSPRPTYKSQRSSNRKTSVESSPIADHLDAVNFLQPQSATTTTTKRDDLVRIKLPPNTHSERCVEAIEQLENSLNERLRKQNLIGKVVNCRGNENKLHIRKRHVPFTWQRGIKIGQGRFGKVYTAVNNSTGEMMAIKEIQIPPNDTLMLKRVAEEMKILEGIIHKNLVRYYGVEVHKDEMLIFMEFCAEGTLEQLVAASENGLSELLVRKYTYQLVCGVVVLHEHGIVHRDIKTANIFLTDSGNCLKIGDFGCAAKIKSNTTMPGELQGFVGTQAYMAPEVFTKNMSEGHGRAADIWSVGCVVVEMASGKRPWSQYDSNYQIMFKVGMGDSPDPPDNMTDEGLDFLVLCFQHNPKDRASAQELLEHSFVKVGDDL